MQYMVKHAEFQGCQQSMDNLGQRLKQYPSGKKSYNVHKTAYGYDFFSLGGGGAKLKRSLSLGYWGLCYLGFLTRALLLRQK